MKSNYAIVPQKYLNMFSLIHKIGIKLRDALHGYQFALTTDLSFKMDVIVGIGLLVFSYFVWPLSQLEGMLLLLGWLLVIITELQNTAIEAALDRIHPERHSDIGASKDMAAAAVLTALVFLTTVIALILYNRLF